MLITVMSLHGTSVHSILVRHWIPAILVYPGVPVVPGATLEYYTLYLNIELQGPVSAQLNEFGDCEVLSDPTGSHPG